MSHATADRDTAARAETCAYRFDHHDPAQSAEPYALYRQMREECPVAWSETNGGFWLVSKYADIEAVARDTKTFSSKGITVPPNHEWGEFLQLPPITWDPPKHDDLKRLLSPFFGSVRWEDAIRSTCRASLDSFIEGGRCDASTEYARGIPIATVEAILGLPPMADVVTEWVRRLIEDVASEPQDALVAAGEMWGFLTEQLADRRENPKDDLISHLTSIEMNGAPLTEQEIFGVLFLVINAGIDTAWGVIAASLYHLANNTEDRHKLTESPELIPRAVEEFLRYFAPAMMARTVAVETEYGGQKMKPGEPVMLLFPSGCRDGDAFPNPDVLDIDRVSNRHFAFGIGIHRCLGAGIARVQIRIALEEWLSRIPEFAVAEDADLFWSPGHVRGLRTLPLTW